MGIVEPIGPFDVFLSHAGVDSRAVEAIAQRLRSEEGLRLFLDRWHISAGVAWQDVLAEALAASTSVAVFIGPSGSTPWVHEETRVAIDRAAREHDEFRVIPVLLPGADLTRIDSFLAQRSWVDFRSGLDDALALQRLAAGVRGEAIADGGFELPDDPAPYRGLLRFEAADDWLFFGRADDTARLIDKLNVSSFAAVIGASGSGKSSLVRAGLIPNLDQLSTGHGGQWRTLICTPGAEPLRSLAEQVARLHPGGSLLDRVDELTDRFADRDDGLVTAVRAYLADDPHPVALVIDQFEELFTGVSDRPAASRATSARFVANLATASSGRDALMKVVVTLRADFCGTALSVDGLSELLQDNQVMLGALTGHRLREAIVKPAHAVGAMFEKGLVAVIMRDVDAAPGALPLLQHALYELWTHRRGPWLTIDAYQDTGGVAGALSARAEQVFSDLPAEQKDAARQIFIRLTSLGEGVPDTRRRVPRDQLYPSGVERSEVDAALLALSGEHARLIVSSDDTVEVGHEALLQAWNRLRDWLESDRDALRVHRRLSQAAYEWAHELDRDPEALYAGARLAEAQEYAEAHADELTDTEAAFVRNSSARATSELEAERERVRVERRRSRALRHRLVAASVAAVLALALGVASGVAFRQATAEADRANREATRAEAEADRANREATRAEAESDRADQEADTSLARALAAESQLIADDNPALALTLAAESMVVLTPPDDRTERALVAARKSLADTPMQQVGEPLTGHTNWVLSVAFSPDGTLLASSDADGTVRLWDPATGAPVGEPLERQARPVRVAFNDDGTLLASAGVDGTVRLWDPKTGNPHGQPLKGHDGRVNAVAFNHDGTRLASSGADGRVWLWDPKTRDPVGEPLVGTDRGWVRGVAFNDDSTLLASTGDDGMVRLWDPATREQVVRPLEGHRGRVVAVAFNDDGTLLASGGADGTVWLWDPRTGDPVETFTGHTGTVVAVSFSPDDSLLASAGDDGTVRLWDPKTGNPHGQPLKGHDGRVMAVAFNHDGTRLASGGDDERVRLWARTTADPVGQALEQGRGGRVSAVAFNPDGTRLASGGDDERVQLRDPATRELVGRPLVGHSDTVRAVAFDPEGRRLASAADDGTVLLWDPATGDPVGPPLEGHSGRVWAVAFSPDGTRLASAGDGGTLRLWDLTADDPVGRSLEGHNGRVWAVAFSPDGSRLASAGDDGTVRLWDPFTGEQVGQPVEGSDPVAAVAFSPDGTLASGGADGMVRLWDPATGDPVGQPMEGDTGWVRAVAFSPDGTLAVSGGDDESVRLWDLATGELVGQPLVGHSGRVLAVAFDPNGTMVASSGADGTVRLWDPAVFDLTRACELASPFVRRSQVLHYLTEGRSVEACQLEE